METLSNVVGILGDGERIGRTVELMTDGKIGLLEHLHLRSMFEIERTIGTTNIGPVGHK